MDLLDELMNNLTKRKGMAKLIEAYKEHGNKPEPEVMRILRDVALGDAEELLNEVTKD